MNYIRDFMKSALLKIISIFLFIQTEGFSAAKFAAALEPVFVHSLRRLPPATALSSRAVLSVCVPPLGYMLAHDATAKIMCQQRRFLSSRAPEEAIEIGNPCIDAIFQYGFAEPKILRDFLNATLDFKGEKAIEDIDYLPREMASADPLAEYRYHFTVDVRCRTKEGYHFLVEMQNEQAHMLSRLDTDQTRRADKNKKDIKKFWKDIQGLYTIIITNKSFPMDRLKSSFTKEPVMEPFLVNAYELRHTKALTRHCGDVPNQIIFLMLDNLKKPLTELSTPIERWAYLFKDSSLKTGVRKIDETKVIEDPALLAGQDDAIQNFMERVNIRNLPREVRERYIRALVYYNTTIMDIELKATAQGMEKGMEKGKAEGKILTLVNLIQNGTLTREAVIKGLSPDETSKLDSQLGIAPKVELK
jgi:predicted transposase/invertase (TIGR01784 family)